MPALGGVALWLGWGASGAVLAMGCGFVLSMLVSAREPWLKVLRGRFDSRYLPEIRRYALPMGASLLVGVLLQWSDRLVLAAHVDHAALGGYSAAGDFAIQGFGLVFSAFHLAWFPRLVAAWERSHDEAQSLLDRYIQLSAVLLVPASLGLALVSAGCDLPVSGPWLCCRCHTRDAVAGGCGHPERGVRTYFTDLSLHLRQAMHRQSVIVGVCAGFSILANLWAVPRYGVIAAAMVAVLSNALGLVLSVMAGWGRAEVQGEGIRPDRHRLRLCAAGRGGLADSGRLGCWIDDAGRCRGRGLWRGDVGIQYGRFTAPRSGPFCGGPNNESFASYRLHAGRLGAIGAFSGSPICADAR